MPDPNPRTILITGATRGLGRALVEGFIDAGHRVLGCGRTRGAILTLRNRYGEPHQFAVVDVARDEQVAAWAAKLLAVDAVPDLVLNNAGLINAPAPLWKVQSEEFSRIVDVNIKGVANVVRHFVPAMIERQRGVIVHLSSGWGRSTSPEMAPYCATKWAIEGLSRALAQELPAGMASVALNPGVIHTEMLEICFGKDEAAAYPGPAEWSRSAVPQLLRLGAGDNGAAATISF